MSTEIIAFVTLKNGSLRIEGLGETLERESRELMFSGYRRDFTAQQLIQIALQIQPLDEGRRYRIEAEIDDWRHFACIHVVPEG